MNTFSSIESYYIRADRTIEHILLTNNEGKQKVIFVYNYEGVHFKVFADVMELTKFLSGEKCNILAEYTTDRGLDKYLGRIKF